MANIVTPHIPGFPDVFQWETDTDALGGADGPMVLPLAQLAERDEYLKGKLGYLHKRIDELEEKLQNGSLVAPGAGGGSPAEDAALTGIKIKTNPKKMTYWTSEKFDHNGLVITAEYSDGTTTDIDKGFTLSAPAMSTSGIKAVVVTYQEKTASFDITVNAPAVSSIKIKTNPTKISYWVAEAFKSAGLVITATWTDGKVQDISSGFTVSSPAMTTAGTKSVTVTYQEKTASFDITVNAPTVTAIAIITFPKTSFVQNAAFSHAGLKIRATWSNGTTSDHTTGFTVSSPAMNTAGTKSVTVTYSGKTVNYNVTVSAPAPTVTSISIAQYPKTTFNNEVFSSSGLVIKVVYSDGTSKNIGSGFTVSAPTWKGTGTYTVTVAFGGRATSYAVSYSSPSYNNDRNGNV